MGLLLCVDAYESQQQKVSEELHRLGRSLLLMQNAEYNGQPEGRTFGLSLSRLLPLRLPRSDMEIIIAPRLATANEPPPRRQFVRTSDTRRVLRHVRGRGGSGALCTGAGGDAVAARETSAEDAGGRGACGIAVARGEPQAGDHDSERGVAVQRAQKAEGREKKRRRVRCRRRHEPSAGFRAEREAKRGRRRRAATSRDRCS